MRKNTMARLLLAVALGLLRLDSLRGRSKARQEIEQAGRHMWRSSSSKIMANLGNNVDVLTQENAALKEENQHERLKSEKSSNEKFETKHHRHTTKHSPTSANQSRHSTHKFTGYDALSSLPIRMAGAGAAVARTSSNWPSNSPCNQKCDWSDEAHHNR
jgi:hypothetical protein